MPAKDGATQLTSSGKRRLDALGRKVLTTPTKQPCCCPNNTCTAPTTLFCACNNGLGPMCCVPEDTEVSLTFPTITPSATIASETYGLVALDVIAVLSGATISVTPLYEFARFIGTWEYWGDVSQVDCCYSYAFRVRLTGVYDTGTGNSVYSLRIDVYETNKGGVVVIGDAFPCPYTSGSTLKLNLAISTVAANGDCCGPDEDIVMDYVDSDYFDDASLTVAGAKFSNDCSYCNNGEFPTVNIDLSQFVGGAPSIVIPLSGNFGTVGTTNLAFRYFDYITPSGGADYITDGDYRWKGLFGIERLIGPDCTTNCCWLLKTNMLIEQYIAGSWVPQFFVFGNYVLCPKSSMAGSYTAVDSTSSPSVTVS
jgi:hypothetical protein